MAAAVLPDTNEIILRRLWPTDMTLYREHLLRLDPVSRHSRFGGGVSDAYIDDYVHTSLRLDTLIYGAFSGSTVVAAGELRILFGAWPPMAETAFSVEEPYQDQGLGDLLLTKIITAARNRGIVTLSMQCLSNNQRMRHLAQKHSAELKTTDGETEARLEPAAFNPLSYMEEWMNEADGALSRMLLWKPSGLN